MRNVSALTKFCVLCILMECYSQAIALNPANDDLDDCGDPFQNAYGPFDYRTVTPFQKQLVEGTHFPRQVEILQQGNTSTLGGDIAGLIPGRTLDAAGQKALQEKDEHQSSGQGRK